MFTGICYGKELHLQAQDQGTKDFSIYMYIRLLYTQPGGYLSDLIKVFHSTFCEISIIL